MLVNFTKMHGLGNDFMLIDNTAGDIRLNAAQIRTLSDRHFGVGFDQLLIVEKSQTADFRYVIFNADGSQAEQCGNGARCFARFVHKKELTGVNPIKIETKSSVMELFINPDNTVTVNMGIPSFASDDVGLLLEKSENYQIEGVELGAVSMGNPHLVAIVDDVNMDIASIATALQQSTQLKNSANIGFMQIINSKEIKLRVFERGVGETLACGSGAAAAVAYGVRAGLLDTKVMTHLNGGDAVIEHTKDDSVFLSGPAQFVFEGVIEI